MKANLQRPLQILELIENKPKTWTCGKLGEHFGITRQEIYRYIKGLRDNGFDIQSSPKGYYLNTKEKSVS